MRSIRVTLVAVALVVGLGLACLGLVSGCQSECLDAKKHMCAQLPEQNCFGAFMDSARARVQNACGAAEAERFFPWAESACRDSTLDCNALPDPTPGLAGDGGTQCGVAVLFDYTGTAEADGRSAQLKITFDGTKVSGSLHADPVCEAGVRLQRTDLTFQGTVSGEWEGEGARIDGSWTGGDYDCDGGPMAGYPTAGTVTITIEAGQVLLQRVEGGGRYVFGTLGRQYHPGC